MDQKVSIVVPVYGVESYLKECVDSLLSQTYTNLEIILIDDGGKDRSPEICDCYGARDERVKVIHKPNGGAASARNTGLDAATGDFICFVDGDDAVRPDYVRLLLAALLEQDADMAVCGFCHWIQSGPELVDCDNHGQYSGQEYLLRFLKDWSCSLLWNKIYRREVIGDIRMQEGHKVDDEFFTYLVVMNCRKVVLFDTPLYDYRLRRSSAMQDMGSHLEQVMLDRVEYLTTRYRNIAQRIPEIEQEFFCDTVDTITRYWNHSKNMPEAQKRIRQWVKEHTRRIITTNLPVHIRFAYLKQLYIKKPTAMSEPNPLQMDAGEYFD